MVTIYEDVPFLSLGEVAEELVAMDEIKLGNFGNIEHCRVEDGLFVAEIVLHDTGDPAQEGKVAYTYTADIDRLRELGIGGTAKYIAFGRDGDDEEEVYYDVLYTFM